MEIRKMLFRKEMKLVTLLLTAMLIASASAAVYYSLSMTSTVTIDQAVVYFEEGSDAGYVSLGTNNTYVSLSLSAYPNVTLTYDDPLNITNTDSSAHEVRLRHVSVTPASGNADVGNFTFINFTLNGVDFDYTTSGNNWNTPSDMSYQSLGATTEWAVKVETRAVAGATDGIDVTIVIALDVR